MFLFFVVIHFSKFSKFPMMVSCYILNNIFLLLFHLFLLEFDKCVISLFYKNKSNTLLKMGRLDIPEDAPPLAIEGTRPDLLLSILFVWGIPMTVVCGPPGGSKAAAPVTFPDGLWTGALAYGGSDIFLIDISNDKWYKHLVMRKVKKCFCWLHLMLLKRFTLIFILTFAKHNISTFSFLFRLREKLRKWLE